MAHKLTFKEYLASKEQLKEAIKNTPKQIIEYRVRSYCKLVTGNKEIKETIVLKPNQTILVEWFYESIDDPTPVKINFKGLPTVNEDTEYLTYWKGHKLSDWLNKNTHKI